uniref:Uncharacterized protein n=1 Tax=Glossina pallidipes TaxID=7398 RepID=A0A1A9ZTI0_GLOPL
MTMSNARELALLEKWSSDAVTIIPPLSSPTSPKATKFCCCPNRRRYNLKQPKLTKTLHVKNIFVDNDFTFIDDSSSTSEEQDKLDKTDANVKNYKRAESWPCAKKKTNATTFNPTGIQQIVNINDISEEPRQIIATINATRVEQKTIDANDDYDDLVELVNIGGNRLETIDKKNVKEKSQQLCEIGRLEESCPTISNNCLTNRSLYDETLTIHKTVQEQEPTIQKIDIDDDSKESIVTKISTQSGNEDNKAKASTTTTATATISASFVTAIEDEEKCENFNRKTTSSTANLEVKLKPTSKTIKYTDEQTTLTTPIQRLSNISEFNSTINCKETSRNSHCNKYCNSNCQFCFNQSCRNFCQLKQSLREPTEPFVSRSNKMTIATIANVTNNKRKRSIGGGDGGGGGGGDDGGVGADGGGSGHQVVECDKGGLSLPLNIETPAAVSLKTIRMADTISPPTTPLRSQPTTPSSPLTTTVIKTTMVKRSPANELTMSTATTPIITSTTPTTPSATTAITSAAALPLTLAERTALLVNQGNVQDVAKENNKPTNKCDVDTRLSVKERIAAFVAGNGKIVEKQ